MALNRRDEAIRLLSAGFVEDFAEFCAGDERMYELMLDLAAEFVTTNIPIVDDEVSFDLAAEMIMGVTITKV